MLKFVFAGAVATVVALAMVSALPDAVAYPDRCSAYPTVDGVPTHPGQFCLHYVPAIGRYENPPAGIPADISRVDPTPGGLEGVRIVAGIFAFYVAFLATWLVIPFVIRPIRSRAGEAST